MARFPLLKRMRASGSLPLLLVPHLANRSWSALRRRGLRAAALARMEGFTPTRLDVLLAVLLATAVLGFVAIVVGFLRGHESVFGMEQGVPWGILVPAYVFVVVTASGLCLISSLGHVFGIKTFEPLGAKAHLLAVVTLISGFIFIGAELERPWRIFIYMVLTPNLSSPIWWMGTLYALELAFQIAEFQFLNRGNMARKSREFSGLVGRLCRLLALGSSDTSAAALRKNMRLARWAGIGGVTFAVAATSTLGTVFGLVEARPWWSGAYMPLYFILTALVSGVAVLGFFASLSYRLGEGEMTLAERGLLRALGKLLLLFLGALVLFMAWNLIERQYGNMPGKAEGLMLLVRGPLSLPFWGLEIALGILAPFFILLYPRTRTPAGLAIASLLAMIGLFASRYDLVVSGQLIPVSGGTEALHYAPSLTEWLIVGGVVSVCAFLYTFTDRVLPRRDIHMDPWE